MVLLVLAALKIEQPKPNPKLKTGNESCEDKLFGSSDLLFLSQQLSKCSLSFVLDKHHAKAEDMARASREAGTAPVMGRIKIPKHIHALILAPRNLFGSWHPKPHMG